jgi:predicted permease
MRAAAKMAAHSAVAGQGISGLSTSKVSSKIILKKVLTFPPFIAFAVALILPHFVDISLANPVLDKLMATMSPMAVFSIGLQLKLGALSENKGLVTTGLFYKLLLAPLLIFTIALLTGAKGSSTQVSIFEASMSSHITISLLASQYGLNPRLCSLITGTGIITGFITSPLWAIILEHL